MKRFAGKVICLIFILFCIAGVSACQNTEHPPESTGASDEATVTEGDPITGPVLLTADQTVDHTVAMTIETQITTQHAETKAGIFFGVARDWANFGYLGYAVLVEGESVTLYRVEENLKALATASITDPTSTYGMRVTLSANYCRVYLDTGNGWSSAPFLSEKLGNTNGFTVGAVELSGYRCKFGDLQIIYGEKVMIEHVTVRNPLYFGADPWVVRHNDKYYYCYGGGDGVFVRQIRSIKDVQTANGSKVYTAPVGTMYSQEYWAPELHYIQGEWYIYVAADDGNNDNHRMYVLKGTTQDPTDPFEMVGQITDSTNKWAIDGTVVTIQDELFFVWSGWEGDVNVAQNLYIAHMSNPWTIDSERVLISTPEYTWEQVGTPTVNEGPTALYHDDDVFIVYSASGSWTDDYCLGLLTLVGEDPLDPASWVKETEPVFSKLPGVAYGPGHCSFATAADDSVWMIYHANVEQGTGWNGRSVWIGPVHFDENGKPLFGEPSEEVVFPLAFNR